MVRVEATPDLVTTNQNDQIKTTEIPAINPKKYLLFSMLENSLFYKLFFSTKFYYTYVTVLLSYEKQQKIIILKEKQFAYTLDL